MLKLTQPPAVADEVLVRSRGPRGLLAEDSLRPYRRQLQIYLDSLVSVRFMALSDEYDIWLVPLASRAGVSWQDLLDESLGRLLLARVAAVRAGSPVSALAFESW